jgi:hypothetical protein
VSYYNGQSRTDKENQNGRCEDFGGVLPSFGSLAMLVRLSGAVLATILALGSAYSGASDYLFEPVSVEVRAGNEAVVAVRLKHKATGKPVSDALIVRTRIDMAPDGMADHASAVKAVPSSEPGVYAFKTDLSMSGRWLLSIAAKVQGETETVVGKVTFRATK